MKRAICFILIFLLCSSVFFSMSTYSTNTAPPRTWSAGLTITGIQLSNSSKEPTEYGEYLNKMHEVRITIENSGNIVLTDIVFQYSVKHGSVTDLTGTDTNRSKLNISEAHTYTFDWTPVTGGGTVYTIYANVTGNNFGAAVGPIFYEKEFVIRDVKKDLGPVGYRFTATPNPGNEYANKSHAVIAKVKNLGNFDLSTPFWVNGTIYSFSASEQLWSDSKLCSITLPANQYCEVTFSTPWQPPAAGMYLLNLSTSLNGDERIENDNLSWLPIAINDIVDGGIIDVENYDNGGVYPCAPITIIADIANQGNLNITANFSALLFINSYPSGATLFSPAPIQISTTGPGNITEPGLKTKAIFSSWDGGGSNPGKVWINISIDPLEVNGSNFNNNLSIIIELLDWTDIRMECITPTTGIYYAEDIKNISVRVRNTGTEDIGQYTVNLTIKNVYTGELWENHTITQPQNGLPWGTSANVEILNSWERNYNAKFNLTFTLAFTQSPGIVRATCTRVFEIKGGRVTGTFSGIVYGSDEQQPLEGITVSVFTTGAKPWSVNYTKTNAVGSFSVDVPAAPSGIEHSLIVQEKDNYWWFEKSEIGTLRSGRSTNINLTILRKPIGRITGNVELTEPVGAPTINEEWTGCTIAIEDTPITTSTDNTGKFDIELVADIVNVTAAKNNFKNAKMEYVNVLSGQKTKVDMTLVEDWHVKVTPGNRVDDVDPYITILADFENKLNISTLSTSTFTILDADGQLIPGLTIGNYSIMKNERTFRVRPPKRLDYNSTYQIKIGTDLEFQDGTPAVHRTWQTTFQTTSGKGTLAGYCTYYWRKTPLENLNITVSNSQNPDLTTQTDGNGYFWLDDIPTGMYLIDVRYANNSTSVKTKNIMVGPETAVWANFTFDDPSPTPSLWGYVEFTRKVMISDVTEARIKVDRELIITCDVPLDPGSINASTIKIFKRPDGAPIEFEKIEGLNNNLKFVLYPEFDLDYNTTYQVVYGRGIRLQDGREISWKDWIQGNFSTEQYALLSKPIIYPPDNAVNVPIGVIITLRFSVSMNRSSVENSINASFKITGFNWSFDNKTIRIEHELLLYFVKYTITLEPQMASTNNIYHLMENVTSSFTTITGQVAYEFGPVLDTKGKPVMNASMALYDHTGALLGSKSTNSTGFATFYFNAHLLPGNYSIDIIKKGYETRTWNFSIDANGMVLADAPPPPIKKKGEDKEGDDIGQPVIGAVTAVLICIFVILLYLIRFRLKPGEQNLGPGPEPEPHGDVDDEEEKTKITSTATTGTDKVKLKQLLGNMKKQDVNEEEWKNSKLQNPRHTQK